jgi:hypothetical protein
LASDSPWLQPKHKNTSSEEDLDASLKNETYKNVSILEFDDCDPSDARKTF